MSLVNDMLRDLDRRRKESSGGAGSVALTPAPEIPVEAGKRPVMVYLIIALVIGAGAIAWFWMQQDGGNITRELNIAPRLAVETVAPQSESEPGGSEAEFVEQGGDSGIGVGLAQSGTTDEVSQTQPNVDVSAGQNFQSVLETDAESTIQEQDSDPVQTTEQIAAVETGSNSPVTSERNQDRDPESNSQLAEGEPPQAAIAQNAINLGEPPAEEVKNASVQSPEEQDVRAVQKALQLIAENRTIEAYAALEQEIIDNRYAHQSRETYAKLLLNEGNHLGAFELIEAGLDLSPNHRGFKKVKARLLIAQGNLSAAVDLLLSRAPPVDSDLEYHEILATAQLASRDYEGALISYSGLVRQDQNQGRWWYGFAASQDSLGNLNAARQGYSRAVNLSNLSANLRRRSQERLAVLSQ